MEQLIKGNAASQSRGTAIVVLGMHRSATSMLARALHARGCALSKELLGAHPSNPSGHWESTVAIDIDDRLLTAFGRSWDDFRAMPSGWLETADAADARNRIRILINEDFSKAALWAIKEPRMCRLAPLWLETVAELGFAPKVVIAVRHPFEVALSLLRRDGLPVAHGLLLWARHLLEAEAASRHVPRLVVDHRQITSDWRGVTRRVGEVLGVQWPVTEEEAGRDLDAAISADRIRINEAADVADGQVPAMCLQLYRHALAAADGNWSDFAALAGRFEDFAQVYDPAIELVYRKFQTLESDTRSSRDSHAQLMAAITEKLDLVEALKSMGERLTVQGERIDDLDRWLGEAQGLNGRMDAELKARHERLVDLEGQMRERNTTVGALETTVDDLERKLHECGVVWAAENEQLSLELQRMRESRSWRVTRPLRGVMVLVKRLRRVLGNGVKALRFIAANPDDLKGVWQRANKEGLTRTLGRAADFARRGGPRPQEEPCAAPQLLLREAGAVILTTPHCLYIAKLMQRALERAGIAAKIIQSKPECGYEPLPHFVICPQMFEHLPDMYVAFQMEQSVSSRWFTSSYFDMLRNSFAVLDYSIDNIAFLGRNDVSPKQIYHVPIGYLEGYAVDPAPEEDYEVVFYGDANCERRREFLEALRVRFKVKVLSEVFGDELRYELSRAKVVVNIHYYQGALLETTRIWECLSLGKLVVSEAAVDMGRHADLEGLVDFVEVGESAKMVERVAYWLEHEPERRTRIADNNNCLTANPSKFDYFFHRFLLASDNLNFDAFWRLAGHRLRLPVDKVCLNLPEYIDRAEDFQKDNQFGFWSFPGLRHSQSWIGCAMSYKLIMLLARQQGMARISICEDDVQFPKDFENRISTIKDYLDANEGQWDVFSGLMADFSPEARIKSVVDHAGVRYVHTDKLISMVYNIYSSRVFDLVERWDENYRDVEVNTIDRYIENMSDVSVVTTDPFLVGHKEHQVSTIWGFQNSQYGELIRTSEKVLRNKVDGFLQGRRS